MLAIALLPACYEIYAQRSLPRTCSRDNYYKWHWQRVYVVVIAYSNVNIGKGRYYYPYYRPRLLTMVNDHGQRRQLSAIDLATLFYFDSVCWQTLRPLRGCGRWPLSVISYLYISGDAPLRTFTQATMHASHDRLLWLLAPLTWIGALATVITMVT